MTGAWESADWPFGPTPTYNLTPKCSTLTLLSEDSNLSSRRPGRVTTTFISESVIRPSAVALVQMRFCVKCDSGEV